VAQPRIAGGVDTGDQDDAFAIEPAEEAVREPLQKDPARVSMNDGVGVGERKSCRDRCFDCKDELGAQTRVPTLLPDVCEYDVIVPRHEKAGCRDARIHGSVRLSPRRGRRAPRWVSS